MLLWTGVTGWLRSNMIDIGWAHIKGKNLGGKNTLWIWFSNPTPVGHPRTLYGQGFVDSQCKETRELFRKRSLPQPPKEVMHFYKLSKVDLTTLPSE
ncbi:unnamed protein product [Citrullus colocynthis]|uniref:Uncharacterized protein n=1 Tax=Citrullus colocynthis TaxID=252529 RepID=A0ABP0YNQ9_9ROSI